MIQVKDLTSKTNTLASFRSLLMGTTKTAAEINAILGGTFDSNLNFLPVSANGYAATVATISDTAGNVNGTGYAYGVTFVTATGETGIVSESNVVSPSSKQVDLTNIPVSTDSRVTKRRIYRQVSAADPQKKQLVGEIDNNTATTFTDNVADGSLGTPMLYINTTGGQIKSESEAFAMACVGTTVFGNRALYTKTGYACSAFGHEALKNNTLGVRNSAFGVYALWVNSTGVNNNAFGVHALDHNTTGSYNNAFGGGALTANISGENNSAYGYASLRLSTGHSNVGYGGSTLFSLAAGSYNTAIGFQAGYSLSAANNCVFVGYLAGQGETLSNRLYIDALSRGSEANCRAQALIYGIFDAATANQLLTVNGYLNALEGFKIGGVAGVSGTITSASTVTVVKGIITAIA